MKLIRLLIVFLVFTAGHAAANTGDTPQFLHSISDVPLMPGLVELTDQSVAFDKPEGRIVETLIVLNEKSERQVRNYYAQTLPQFGWQQTKNDSFVRGKERLELSFEAAEGQGYLKMMVKPR